MVLWVLGPNTPAARIPTCSPQFGPFTGTPARAQACRNGPKRPLTCAHFFRTAPAARGTLEREPQRTVRCCHRRAGGPPEPREHSSRAAAPPEPPWAPPHSSKVPCSDRGGGCSSDEEHRVVEKEAGGGGEGGADLGADGDGAGGRAGGALQRRIEDGSVKSGAGARGGPRTTASISGGKSGGARSKHQGGGARLSAHERRPPQPYLHAPKMYFDAHCYHSLPGANVSSETAQHTRSAPRAFESQRRARSARCTQLGSTNGSAAQRCVAQATGAQAGVEVANGFCMSAMAACTKAGTLWGPVVHHYPP